MKCMCLTNSDTPGLQHMDHCPWSRQQDSTVLAFRNGVNRPIAVPEEIVTQAERAYRAYVAHRSGKSWDAIAVEEQYPDAAAARADVKSYLTEGQALMNTWTRQELLAMEVERLNYMQACIWRQVEQGHLPAINAALGIVAMRVKIQKLDEARPDESIDGEASTVVVVPNDEEGYMRALQKVTGNG